MLIILFIFALIRSLRGVPLSSPLDDPNGFPALDLHDTSSHFGERAISDIILSCFATIFACTWSAVHPNIPATTDCPWTRFKRQVLTMVYALLAPEAITAWALRQRLAARWIMDSYNEEIATYKGPKTSKSNCILDTMRAIFHDSPLPSKLKAGHVPQWTLAHGFFLQMGGFMLSEGGQPIQIMNLLAQKTGIIKNIKGGKIDPPSITEDDIQDRSKGDAISKTLIMLQTTWFIAQCVARWSNHLPVTELEVVTLGFAMLNGITYGLWWHKPQNVGRPVFLEIKHKKPQGVSRGVQTKFSTTEESGSSEAEEPKIEHPEPDASDEEATSLLSKNTALSKESYVRRKLQEDIEEHIFSEPWKLLYCIPLHLVKGLLRPLTKLADYDWRLVHSGDLHMPMFYSANAADSKVYGPTTVIGVLFGSVHLITSWFLQFASTQEMWFWWVSAIIITVAPIFLGLYQYSKPGSIEEHIFKFFLMGGLPLYIISRIILLTLALTSLRALPSAALQTVDWTTFIPHI